MVADRYGHLESHADLGEGADEPEIARYTRPCERRELHQAHLGQLADEAWQRMDEARGTDRFERLRDLAMQAKDDADAFARSVVVSQRILRSDSPPKTFGELVERTADAARSKTPPSSSAKNQLEGTTPIPQED